MVCKTSGNCWQWRKNRCFNPCYVGLWSVSDCRLTPAEINVGFNPCYVGLWSVSAYRVFDLLVKATFQSLLCWIMVCKMIDRISNCENLNEFQSLLCWIMVCKTAYPHLPKPSSTGFNPCYVGLWSVSDCLEALRNLPDKFQSLLCWIMVCKYAITSLCGGDIQFQSLLCWIMVCKKHPSIHKLADVFGFQSLLCWIMVCKERLRQYRRHCGRVSILVMLDYGL